MKKLPKMLRLWGNTVLFPYSYQSNTINILICFCEMKNGSFHPKSILRDQLSNYRSSGPVNLRKFNWPLRLLHTDLLRHLWVTAPSHKSQSSSSWPPYPRGPGRVYLWQCKFKYKRTFRLHNNLTMGTCLLENRKWTLGHPSWALASPSSMLIITIIGLHGYCFHILYILFTARKIR